MKQPMWGPALNPAQETGDVIPRCRYFGRCGGCQLQHWSYARQSAEKARWLRELFRSYPSPIEFRPLMASPRVWHYRRRMQLHIDPWGKAGFFAAKSRQVVAIESCDLALEELNAQIRAVELRAQRDRAECLTCTDLTYELTLREDGEVAIRRGQEERSFLQINAEANDALLACLKNALAAIAPRRVLELYAGSGNFSYALAGEGIAWTAVESNAQAVQQARLGSAKYKLEALSPPIRWVHLEASAALKTLLSQGCSFDAVLADPPRRGLEKALVLLAALKPEFFLYVSCYPPAMSRDLQQLARLGYAVEWLQPIDFFPHTVHLEVVGFCRRVHS